MRRVFAIKILCALHVSPILARNPGCGTLQISATNSTISSYRLRGSPLCTKLRYLFNSSFLGPDIFSHYMFAHAQYICFTKATQPRFASTETKLQHKYFVHLSIWGVVKYCHVYQVCGSVTSKSTWIRIGYRIYSLWRL
jgi:hypothetical protein